MLHQNRSAWQTNAWIFSGLTAPLALFCAGCGWKYVLTVSALCAAAAWFVSMYTSGIPKSKPIALGELVWLTVILGYVAQWIDDGWPMGESFPTVPITVILLAAMSASKGAEKASAIGGILIRILVIVYAAICFTGLSEWKADYIGNAGKGDIRLVPILLTTALAIYLPGEERKKNTGAAVGAAVFAGLISVLVMGNISAKIACGVENPFFEWVRGLESKGVASHFEAIAAAGMMLGWFSLFAYLLSIASTMGEMIWKGSGKKTLWICAGVGVALLITGNLISGKVAVIGCILAWIVIPVFYEAAEKIKVKKMEKSA